MLFVVPGGKITVNHQYLFGMKRIHFWTGGRNPACLRPNRNGIPGFTRAKAIQMSGLQVGHHLLRRQDHEAHLAIRVNPVQCKPAAQQMPMR